MIFLAVGDNSANAISWFPGETKGYDITGINTVVAPPTTNADVNSAVAHVLFTGTANPTAAPTGTQSPLFMNVHTNKEVFWDGTTWLPVSGA